MNKNIFSDYIKRHQFKKLFIELGWNDYNDATPVSLENQTYTLKGVAEKRGFTVVLCEPCPDGTIPLSDIRKKIEHNYRKVHQEHLLIFPDRAGTKQIWQFIIPEADKPRRIREITYENTQDSESLYQRARGLLFTIDEEERITLIDVKARFEENLAKNSETVTKKFYTEFKKHHSSFLAFIEGIDDAIKDKDNKNKQWYASLMLNRLMFCYFIQKKNYLDNNPDYLQEKLKEVKNTAGKHKFYQFYRDFLLQLFHHGLGQPETNRETTVNLGKIPYLNGGLFDVHALEKQFTEIKIKDDAFEKLFDFFDEWNWHLDTRVEATGKDINPDVIGYIFEKYINDRAAMGAYYTKEDITEYIGKNTIIPFLFDKTKEKYPEAFAEKGHLWEYFRNSGDTYIYDAVKYGVPDEKDIFTDLPDDIRHGFNPELENKLVDDNGPHLFEIRKCWNKRAPGDIALPTEIYREVIERRKRYADIVSRINSGAIHEMNDFITYNLNIRQFTQDILHNTNDPEFIEHFYKALCGITILDPTCGSGAFLFAAMNILEPLYETCIERMEQFTAEEPRKYKYFHEVLATVNSEEHPNLQYFIYKTIILNNLYGVDIMHEAVEIAKLRLFLKMVGAVDINVRKQNYGLEPLPDIDFNIRTGNTLVGFATEKDLQDSIMFDSTGTVRVGWEEKLKLFKEECFFIAKKFIAFRKVQTLRPEIGSLREVKEELNNLLNNLTGKMNVHLSETYGIYEGKFKNKKQYAETYQKWLESHQPFHWFAEYYDIINENGGFDVVIGNPPYVEYSQAKKNYQITGYETITCGNLYVNTIERCIKILSFIGSMGMIVQLPIVCSNRMLPIQKMLLNQFALSLFSTFDDRPGKLFDGLEHIRATVFVIKKLTSVKSIYSTRYIRWNSEFRNLLFNSISYLKNENLIFKGAIPKIGNINHRLIFKKLEKQKLLSNFLHGNKMIYFHNAPQYWIRATIKPPYFWNEADGEKISPHIKAIITESNKKKLLLAILNSSLFYSWFITLSNCRDFTNREIEWFPASLDTFDERITEKINVEVSDLLSCYEKNKLRKETYYKATGKVIFDEYFPKKSKITIDQIDTLLAQHYGFTESELDFIINYDIKYRMGKALFGEEDSEDDEGKEN